MKIDDAIKYTEGLSKSPEFGFDIGPIGKHAIKTLIKKAKKNTSEERAGRFLEYTVIAWLVIMAFCFINLAKSNATGIMHKVNENTEESQIQKTQDFWNHTHRYSDGKPFNTIKEDIDEHFEFEYTKDIEQAL